MARGGRIGRSWRGQWSEYRGTPKALRAGAWAGLGGVPGGRAVAARAAYKAAMLAASISSGIEPASTTAGPPAPPVAAYDPSAAGRDTVFPPGR